MFRYDHKRRGASPMKSAVGVRRREHPKPAPALFDDIRLRRALGNGALQGLRRASAPGAERVLLRGAVRLGPDAGRGPALRQSGPVPGTGPVNLPGDRHEREADQAADRIMRAPPGPHPQNSGRAAAPGHDAAGGAALDPDTRRFFESRFGRDFAKVRIHADSAGNASARRLSARAYTVGNDVTFATGEYRPREREGRRLLAHELAHVVQQNRAPASARSHGAATSLSPAPAGVAQRKLVATGDAAGFARLANTIVTVQFEVVVSTAGVVSVRSTNIQGPPTPAEQELISVLNTVIGDSKTTVIEFIHGTTSTRSSDANVIVGNYQLARIDLDDVAQGGAAGGRGLNAGTMFAHEIQEQYRKQAHGESFAVAHAAGLATEARAAGAVITPGNLTQINATTIEFTDEYAYPDGTREAVTVTVTNGNITNVARRMLP